MSGSDNSERPDTTEPSAATELPEDGVTAALDEESEASSSWWRWCIVAGVALFVLVIDQLSKSWAVERLSNHQIIDVVWTLRFNLAFNTGMAFSKGSGSGAIIGLVVVVVVVVLLFMARTMRSRVQLVLIGLIIGGAVGNVLDRMFRAPLEGTPDGFMRGAVVDFIDVQWWPIWNVADMAVVVGAIALALYGLRAEPDDDPSTEDLPEGPAESAGSSDPADSTDSADPADPVGGADASRLA